MKPFAVAFVGLLLMGLTAGIDTMLSPSTPRPSWAKDLFIKLATPPHTGCAKTGLLARIDAPATRATATNALRSESLSIESLLRPKVVSGPLPPPEGITPEGRGDTIPHRTGP